MEMILNKNDNNIPVDSTTQIYDFLNKELKNKEKTDKSCEEIMKMKFKTKKYYIDSKGKKRKERKGRKYKSDDIRKKIKVKFHKTIKDIINKNLKELGSKKFFKFLPQFFMGNISQKFNYKYLEYSYKDLLLTDFALCQDEYRNKKIDYKNYLNNKDTIAYLEENEELSINSGFYLIKDMKYKDILKAYFSSKQFENSIIELKNSYSNEELNNENFNEFLLTRGSLKAIELLNDKLYFKLFKNENFPNIEIIIVYRIYFQLVNKEKNIIEENDIEIFWKKVKEYFINKNNNNIQIGNLLENQFKQLDFSKENFVKIYNLCEGKINKLTPVYYSKICATTGLFIFLIKEALEYFGIINDKKKTQINRIYQNLCFLLEIKKKEFEKL
jgi:hypothetical protein